MVTVSAAADVAPVCVDAVGVRTTPTVVCCAFVDIYTVHHHQLIN